MKELDRHNLKVGSRVKMWYYGRWAKGEVTIIKDYSIKVIFDGPYDLDYTYYPIEDLELDDE